MPAALAACLDDPTVRSLNSPAQSNTSTKASFESGLTWLTLSCLRPNRIGPAKFQKNSTVGGGFRGVHHRARIRATRWPYPPNELADVAQLAITIKREHQPQKCELTTAGVDDNLAEVVRARPCPPLAASRVGDDPSRIGLHVRSVRLN